MYDTYLSCRQVQLFSFTHTRGKKTVVEVIEYVTGFHSLPEDGGILDQPYRLMEFFESFREGENLAAFQSVRSA